MEAPADAATLPHPVKLYLAAREMRLHHYLWHGSRNGWLTTFSEETKERFREIGWEPPRPALRLDDQGNPRAILDNDSGEDFLYMHRQMIEEVNRQLARLAEPAYAKVQGWSEVPPPEDPDYPVPPPFEVPDDPDATEYFRSRKTVEFYRERIVPWQRASSDPDNLRSMSLGRLGAELEFTIHNAMHVRWSEPVARMRPDPSTSEDPRGVPPEWDDVSYDWLGDTYSSHVNDVFWKLHGWVDSRIDIWAKANGIDQIEWKGTWEGPHDHVPHPDHPHGARLVVDRAASDTRLVEMEEVVRSVGTEIPAGFPPTSIDGP